MNPILLDIPMPILTPRLLIRPPEAGDGKALNEAVLESFNELEPFIPWARQRPTLEESELNCRHAAAKWISREDLQLRLFDRKTGQFVGGSGLHRANWNIPSFEIGYWVRTSLEKQGFITEAVNAIARFAFLELKAKRLELRCVPENLGSRRIAEKLGFELEGCLKKSFAAFAPASEPQDSLVFALFSYERLPTLDVSW